MMSTYELRMLAKLAHEDTLVKAQMRRFARSVKKQAATTSDEYRQFVVREERPCRC